MASQEEVVTTASVRTVPVPGLDRPAALVTLDNGDPRRPNTLGPAGLESLDRAIGQALATRPGLLAVTGTPGDFCAGADLTAVPRLAGREQALGLGRLGHRVFARLRDAPVPTVASISGPALGGGLELALHCHYRAVSAGAGPLAFPEVLLGLVPAWGGTQLLPRLVGIDGAVRVIVQNPLRQNRMLTPAQAGELGMVDAVLEPDGFLERSLAWAAGVVRGEVRVSRPGADPGAWDAVVAAARAQLDQRLHGAVPAAYRALDLLALARDGAAADGAAAEEEALADLVMTDQLRSGLYAFDLVQRRAKQPAGAPDGALAREVTRVGVVGAGLMASQLALLFASRLRVPVVMTDLDQPRVDRGLSYVHREVDKLVERGRLTTDRATALRGLVTGSVDKAALAGADFVVEAVFEELDVKRRVFAELEAVVTPECVLATNTSSLSVTGIAVGLAHPGRVLGFHFFNPVAVLPLLEVVRAGRTDQTTLATAFATARRLGKSAVLVADAPGFVVNRLLFRFLSEIFAAIDAGTPVPVADAALDPLGLPMRPLALLELVGPGVAHHVAQVMHAAFPDRFAVSDNLARVARAGHPGLLGPDGQVDPEVAALLQVGDAPYSAEQVRHRALDALAGEIRLMLDAGVVVDPRDIDLCLILGAGWPFHLGGITPYLDRAGVAQRVTGARFLPPGVATLP
jgi:3-hydroxyacyl-CoA dehydrogenase/enoyl-CoA hydratase/carnithine racemase